MELSKIQQEQADALRQEKILNDFIRAHPWIKTKQTPKSRDLLAAAQATLLSAPDNNSGGVWQDIASSQSGEVPKHQDGCE